MRWNVCSPRGKRIMLLRIPWQELRPWDTHGIRTSLTPRERKWYWSLSKCLLNKQKVSSDTQNKRDKTHSSIITTGQVHGNEVREQAKKVYDKWNMQSPDDIGQFRFEFDDWRSSNISKWARTVARESNSAEGIKYEKKDAKLRWKNLERHELQIWE